jgi:Tol biopolymer transport system component
VTVLQRALLLGATLLLVSSLPAPASMRSAAAQSAPGGRVLATARGQVAWLDLLAPRPKPVTQLVRPAYPSDVGGAAGVPFAVASVVSDLNGAGALGSDLLLIDLQTTTTRTLLARNNGSESLDLPAVWPDGSGILYQRSDLRAAVPMPGQAQPQYRSNIEQVDPSGETVIGLLQDGRYPGPAPDGSQFAFVRSTDSGTAILSHSMADGSDRQLVAPGRFLALAYPRFSPDGQTLAFAAVSLMSPIGRSEPHAVNLLSASGRTGPDAGSGVLSWLATRSALAHGFPWEVWLVNADGSGLRQIQDVQNDDPSVAWSPDGSQLLVYGGWGSFVVDAGSGTSTTLAFLAGYGSIAWLPSD